MRSIILITMLLAVSSKFAASASFAGTQSPEICASAVRAAERSIQLPHMLLHAISLAESGRWDAGRQASLAWPWTVNAGGKGRYFPTKKAAVAEVRRLRGKGVRNIDVGCMQINLMHHGAAFEDIEEALDPIHNTAYAATFLKGLRNKAGSWAHAIGRYHTSNWKNRGRHYWRKVSILWTSERRRDFRARRAARIKANLRRRVLAKR